MSWGKEKLKKPGKAEYSVGWNKKGSKWAKRQSTMPKRQGDKN